MASEITPLVFTLQLKLDSLDNLLLYVVVYTIFALLLLFCLKLGLSAGRYWLQYTIGEVG